ncbi:MAG: hypothetical protein ACR2QF_08870 [Geminicoccaceae bacterium]
MKARYEIDQKALSKMDVEIAFSMPLDEWRQLAEQIKSVDATWPGSKFLGQLNGTIRNIDDTTSTHWKVCEWGRAEPSSE